MMKEQWHAVIRSMLVIARRDYMSVVATPGFLLFLLGPLFMLGMVLLGAVGGSQYFEEGLDAKRIVALVPSEEVQRVSDANIEIRNVMPRGFPALQVRARGAEELTQQAAQAVFNESGSDTHAVFVGPLDNPTIYTLEQKGMTLDYLQILAQTVARDNVKIAAVPNVIIPRKEQQALLPSYEGRQIVASQTVTLLFLLVILLAGQSVGMMAEEKGNKIIEILAGAVPLESVFLGKLLGLLGVAFTFIAFWVIVLGGVGGVLAALSSGAATLTPDASEVELAKAAAEQSAQRFVRSAPATGWTFFLSICFGYFIMLFLLLGSLFLGAGALAGSVRELQLLSLPVTVFQVAMLSLALAGASDLQSPLGLFAQIFPFSSPFTMAARAATEDGVAIHFIALGWQVIWVGVVVFLSSWLFRTNILDGRGRFLFWKRSHSRMHEEPNR